MVLKMGKSFPTTSGKSEPNSLMNAVWDQDKSRWTWGPWKCLTKKYNECAFSIFMHFLAMSVNQHRIHGSQKNTNKACVCPLHDWKTTRLWERRLDLREQWRATRLPCEVHQNCGGRIFRLVAAYQASGSSCLSCSLFCCSFGTLGEWVCPNSAIRFIVLEGEKHDRRISTRSGPWGPKWLWLVWDPPPQLEEQT